MKKLAVRMFLLVVGLILAGPHPFLFLRDFNTKETIGEVPLRPNDSFTMEWIHSVELTPWRETYQVDWFDGMQLARTSFRSFGAGVPSEVEGAKTEVVKGWIVVTNLHQPRDSVLYLISRDDYKLSVGEQMWKLTDLMPLGTSLELFVKWRPWWYRYLYKMQGKEVTAG
jgi:hypothetical protein